VPNRSGQDSQLQPLSHRENPAILPNSPTPNPVYDSPGMLGNRTNEQWIAQYSSSHQHPINRACHTLGIPTILVSVAIFVASIFLHRLWPYATALFVVGWVLQFIGHAFEGKAPEFFSDWRFLFVGVRWWWAKIRGQD
jgi:uncharacterized membrane protein YGL010W